MANFAHLAQVGMEPEHLVLWAWHLAAGALGAFSRRARLGDMLGGRNTRDQPAGYKLTCKPVSGAVGARPGARRPAGRPEHLIWWAGLSVHGSSRPVDDGRAPTKLAFFFPQQVQLAALLGWSAMANKTGHSDLTPARVQQHNGAHGRGER